MKLFNEYGEQWHKELDNFYSKDDPKWEIDPKFIDSVTGLAKVNLSIEDQQEINESLKNASRPFIEYEDFLDNIVHWLTRDEIDEEVDEFTDELLGGDLEFSSHYVSNNEADEDYRSTLIQDSNRYKDSHMTTSFPIVDPFTSVSEDYDNHLKNLRERGFITQSILDYVDMKGAVTYTEMSNYYKSITGSNSFSHILANLRIPYKNRKTQRYVAKEGKRYSDALYVIKVANPSNWVIVDC